MRPGGGLLGKQARCVAMGHQNAAIFPGDLFKPHAKRKAARRQHHLSADRVGDETEQLVLVTYMPVQRGRLHAEAFGQAARTQRLKASFLHELKRRIDELVASEPDTAARGCCGGWRANRLLTRAFSWVSHA